MQDESASKKPKPRRRWSIGRGLRWLFLRLLIAVLALVVLFAVLNPPTTWTILTEERDYPGVTRRWAPIEGIAPVMVRSVVAAEDANFCRHWGFDMTEIRKVIESGSSRGASTITQQVAKNVYLWQGERRNWPRKALEAALTPLIEAVWTKRRIAEVYLNVAEFGPGVFGIHAGAAYHYKTTPDKLTATQAARLAAILPGPKVRNPNDAKYRRRARAIADGAATIAADGRDGCMKLGKN